MAIINGTANDDILVDVNNNISDDFNGRGGNDTLLAETTWADNVIFDMAAGHMEWEGDVYDTFRNIENLTLGGGADVIGDDKANVIRFVNLGGESQDNEVHAGGGNDKVFGGVGSDELYGNAGKDILKGGQGHDGLFGGKGNDILKGGDGHDFLVGGNGKDTLEGGDGNDVLVGGNGKDILKGGEGDDELYGEDGDDTLKGGKGDDVLAGGAGDDILKGGEGADVFYFSADNGFDVIKDFENGTDLLDLTSFGFANGNEAQSHFFEKGTANNNAVWFEYDGTTIKIKGLDLEDIDGSDVII